MRHSLDRTVIISESDKLLYSYRTARRKKLNLKSSKTLKSQWNKLPKSLKRWMVNSQD